MYLLHLAVFVCICLYFYLFTSCVGVFGFLFVYFLCLFFVAQAGLPGCLPLVGLDGWGSTLLYTSLLYLFNFVFVFIRISTRILRICVICLMYLLGCDGWDATHCSLLCCCILLHFSLLCFALLSHTYQLQTYTNTLCPPLFRPKERGVR